jgi:uncharacterized membrane-anchored protein YhcB (DUF1043 family)
MSWDSLTYLVEMSWPFLGIALIAGVVTGWLNARAGRR